MVEVRAGKDALFVQSPSKQLTYEGVEIGQKVPSIVRGPVDVSHMARWASAIQDWHKIHYDWKWAVEHDKLPDVLVNGSWMQCVLDKMLREWLGEAGWLWKFGFQLRGMSVPGDKLTFGAQVRDKYQHEGWGIIEFDIWIEKGDKEFIARGEAVGVLPSQGGKPVPHPFPYPFRLPGQSRAM